MYIYNYMYDKYILTYIHTLRNGGRATLWSTCSLRRMPSASIRLRLQRRCVGASTACTGGVRTASVATALRAHTLMSLGI